LAKSDPDAGASAEGSSANSAISVDGSDEGGDAATSAAEAGSRSKRKQDQMDHRAGDDAASSASSRKLVKTEPQMLRNWLTADSVRVYIPQMDDEVIFLVDGYAESIARHHDAHHGVRCCCHAACVC